MMRYLLRLFSIKVPVDQLKITHLNPSNPEDQSENKKECRVDIRFSMDSSNWIPKDVKEKLKEMYPFFVDKDEFFVQSNSEQYVEFNDSKSNEIEAIEKLQIMLNKDTERRNPKAIIEKLEAENRKKPKNYERQQRAQIKNLRRDKFQAPQ